MTATGNGYASFSRRSTGASGGSAARSSSSPAVIRSTTGRTASTRRALNAGAMMRRSRRWSAPYEVNMLRTAIQSASGQLCTVSAKAGQWARPSLETSGLVSRALRRDRVADRPGRDAEDVDAGGRTSGVQGAVFGVRVGTRGVEDEGFLFRWGGGRHGGQLLGRTTWLLPSVGGGSGARAGGTESRWWRFRARGRAFGGAACARRARPGRVQGGA